MDDPTPAPLYEHCARAIDRVAGDESVRAAFRSSAAGDWNDGLSAVGLDMKGESIWLGHFLHRILLDFAEIAAGEGTRAASAVPRARHDPPGGDQ